MAVAGFAIFVEFSSHMSNVKQGSVLLKQNRWIARLTVTGLISCIIGYELISAQHSLSWVLTLPFTRHQQNMMEIKREFIGV